MPFLNGAPCKNAPFSMNSYRYIKLNSFCLHIFKKNRKCSGLILNSYIKYDDQQDRLFEKRLSKSLNQYKKFKSMLTLPDDFSSKDMAYFQTIFY